MTRILLFSFATLLCYIQTDALKCIVCNMLTGCGKDTGGTCEALPGQQCRATHVFKGLVLLSNHPSLGRKRTMNKILLLSISILLCCIQVQALTCRVCRVLSGCREDKKESCEALPGQQCTSIKFFKEGKEMFHQKGCSLPGDKCSLPGRKKYEGWGTMEKVCCNDQDYCNE